MVNPLTTLDNDAEITGNVKIDGNLIITGTQTGGGSTPGPNVPNSLGGWDNSGNFADVLVGSGLSLAGGTLIATGAGSGTVTSITTGTGLSGGTITTVGTIAIANTAVTPGVYTNANITVNQQGQITAAANGTGGGVTNITNSDGTLTISPPNGNVVASLAALTNGHILVGNGSNIATNVAMSGDATLSNTGTITVTKTNGVPFGTAATENLTAVITDNGSGGLTIGIGQVTGAMIVTSVPLAGSPTTTTQASADSSTKIATTSYVTTLVNNAIAGINPAVAVMAATAGSILPNTPTYNNGSSGVGATLTAGSNGVLVIDGYTVALNDRLLIKDQVSAFQNGVYTVTTLGTVSVPYVLTRATDYNQPSNINSTGAIPVVTGTANAGTQWVLTAHVGTVGTDPLTYAQFSINPSKVLANTLTNGHVFIGNASNIATDQSISGDGTITNTGVLTVTKTNGVAFAPSATTDTTNANNITSGTLAIARGGTGQGTAAAAFNALSPITTTGDLIIGTGANAAGRLAIGTNGTILGSNGTTAAWVAAGGTGSVTSVGTGAGLTGGPITTTGTISFATIADGDLLANTSGVTAVPSATTLTALLDHVIGTSQGDIIYRNATTWVPLAPGTSGQLLSTGGASANPSWTNAATGTVTSVAMTGDGTIFNSTVGGSPITTSGTLVPALLTQVKNIFLGGPSSGSAASPTFRGIVLADFPTIANNTALGNVSGSTAVPTALTATQLTTLVNAFTSSLSGAAPASGGGTTNFLRADGTWTTPGGGGTVTSFSAGNLSPLFTTSVATATTTPALTFSLSTFAANTVYANITGSTAAPSATSITTAVNAGLPLTTLGDILYENATPTPARLAGNTTSTKKFLTQTGTGSLSAAPAWGTVSTSDVSGLGTAATENLTAVIIDNGSGGLTIGAGQVTGSMIASSVALAGSPTTTTQAITDSSTKIATTAFVSNRIASVNIVEYSFFGGV